MSKQLEDTRGCLRNPGREARQIESELVRRLGLMGIGADDSAAIRQLFERSSVGKGSRQQESMTSDLLGLGLLLVKLVRQSLAMGSGLKLEPATRAMMDAMLGRGGFNSVGAWLFAEQTGFSWRSSNARAHTARSIEANRISQ